MTAQALVTSGFFPALLAALSVVLVFAGLGALRSGDELRQRIDRYGSNRFDLPATGTTLEDLELQQSFTKRVLWPLILRLSRFIGSLLPNKRFDKLQHRLELAGNPGSTRVVEFA